MSAMRYQLVVRPQVEADIVEAAAWYEQQQQGLGVEFTQAIRDEIRRLIENPHLYRVRHRRFGIRWLNVSRFPYRIVYRVQAAELVVLAVLHSARHDRRWKESP